MERWKERAQMLQQERWDFVQKWKAREAGRADAAGAGAPAEAESSSEEDEDEVTKRQIDSDDDF